MQPASAPRALGERAKMCRRELEHAIHAMRFAERVEGPCERVRFARQAILRWISARRAAESATLERGSPALALALLAATPGFERYAALIARITDETPAAGWARREFDALAALFARLERSVDLRTPRELWLARWLPRCIAAAALLFVICAADRPKNLALGRPVTTSSTCGLAPDAPLGKEPFYRVVDGREREITFAVCTENEQSPWLSVDLGRRHRIDEVVIYPRNDCCYGEDELPFDIELSDDDIHFDRVGTETSPATGDAPWRLSGVGRQARYVRLAGESPSARHIVISELEVYGS